MNYKPSDFLKSQNPDVTEEMWKQYIGWITYAMDTDADNFQSQIIRLGIKADSGNREKLRLSFPVEVMLSTAWKMGDIEMVKDE